MATKDDCSLPPKLGVAIDTSLSEWETYLNTLTEQPTYETLVSSDIQNTATKTKALLHLLEVLPSRHAALVIAYGDANIKYVELSTSCANLLGDLSNPESDVDLESSFNRTLCAQKLKKSISQLESDIQSAEQGRLQELRRLKAIHQALTESSEHLELREKYIEKLLNAMEELNVALAVPGAFVEFGSEVDGNHKDART